MRENRAAWLMEKQRIEINRIPVPEPKPGEVLVKIEYVGMCGSDMHFYETGRYSKGPIPGPLILGHECAGTVEEVGEGVTHLKPGDRVALEPGKACGECEQCRSGRYNLCPNVEFISVPPYNGALRDYITHSAALCFKLPERVSTLEGALIEPFAVGLHAARTAGMELGKTAVLLGAGCIGLMTLLACRAMGATRIIAADLADFRLQKAMELGADFVIRPDETDCEQRVKELTGGIGADIVFETAGSPATLKMASRLARSGGTVMMVGNIFEPVLFDFWDVAHREITIKSIYRYRYLYPLAIQMLEKKLVDLPQLVTNIYPFEQAQEAFASVSADKEHTLKGVIRL